MVSCRDAWRQIRDRLEQAGLEDPSADANLLLELAAGANWRWQAEELDAEQQEKLKNWTKKRIKRWPIQYLVGHWPFLDLDLEVGPGVLVPRADTEVVCQAAADLLKGQTAPRILDLCAGSGALGLGLKRLLPGALVTELEASAEAFPYLERNCQKALPQPDGSLAAQPVFGDVFQYQEQLEQGQWDLIVSNPPYLTESEMGQLQPEVAFEPAMALDGGSDGLDFYRHIASAYRSAVRPGGWLVFEIGWQQREAVQQLLRNSGWTQVGGCPDFGGNDRAVWAQNPILNK